MRLAGFALVIFACALFIPSWMQRRKTLRSETDRADRAEAWAEDCLAMLNEAEERVAYWRNQYHGGVDAIVDRLRAAVHEEAPDDAAVLEWLDDATEWTQ